MPRLPATQRAWASAEEKMDQQYEPEQNASPGGQAAGAEITQLNSSSKYLGSTIGELASLALES